MTEEIVQKSHAERHPNDVTTPKGFIRIRVDGGDSQVKLENRIYAFVPTGYGTNLRIAQVRKTGKVRGSHIQLMWGNGSPCDILSSSESLLVISQDGET